MNLNLLQEVRRHLDAIDADLGFKLEYFVRVAWDLDPHTLKQYRAEQANVDALIRRIPPTFRWMLHEQRDLIYKKLETLSREMVRRERLEINYQSALQAYPEYAPELTSLYEERDFDQLAEILESL